FFVANETVLTNAHVLCPEGQPLTVIFSDGRRATGVPMRSDTLLDLAVVHSAGATAPPLPLGDAGSLNVGDHVVLVGSPVGLEFTVHEGTVSSISRTLLGLAYIQLDAKVNPGNSGGALLDKLGRVVGIVSLKVQTAEGIGLALPINYAYDGAGALISG